MVVTNRSKSDIFIFCNRFFDFKTYSMFLILAVQDQCIISGPPLMMFGAFIFV